MVGRSCADSVLRRKQSDRSTADLSCLSSSDASRTSADSVGGEERKNVALPLYPPGQSESLLIQNTLTPPTFKTLGWERSDLCRFSLFLGVEPMPTYALLFGLERRYRQTIIIYNYSAGCWVAVTCARVRNARRSSRAKEGENLYTP